jgi:serine protease Do
VAGIDEKGPAKPAGIELGDVIVKFDGKDIKDIRDLPRVVADTPVGKDVAVIIIRKGKEETKTVKLGRLEDGEKQAALTNPADPGPAPVVKKTLGLELSSLTDDLRKKYKIKDTVKGIVVLGVEQGAPASSQQLSPGDVIVEVAQEAVSSADDFQAKIDKLKGDGRQSVPVLVAGVDGELRFVALRLQ